MKFADIKPIPGYEDLERVLCAAYLQAAVGKGAERHADAKPFIEQPMQAIALSAALIRLLPLRTSSIYRPSYWRYAVVKLAPFRIRLRSYQSANQFACVCNAQSTSLVFH
jgi:hypothetical protein